MIQIKDKLRRQLVEYLLRTTRSQEIEMDAVLHDTPDHVACARPLGPLLAAAADEIERDRESRASIVSALIDNGMFSATAPQMGSPRSFQKAHSPMKAPCSLRANLCHPATRRGQIRSARTIAQTTPQPTHVMVG